MFRTRMAQQDTVAALPGSDRLRPTGRDGTGSPAMNFPAMTGWSRGLAALLIAAAATAALAQDENKQAPKQKTEQKAKSKGVPYVDLGQVTDKGALRLLPPDSVTHHSIETASGPIRYTATAGTLPLYDTS